MSLRVSGKNVDIGEALRGHVEQKVGETIEKYFAGGWNGHVTVEREGALFRTDCALHLATGVDLKAEGLSHEPYPSVEQALERMEKQLRRYKRKLRDHHGGHDRMAAVEGTYRVIEAADADEEVPVDFNPLVIAETTKTLKSMTVGMAVMEMDLTHSPFVMFLNAANGGLNVVYKRRDGNIGWIDPSLPGAAS